MNEAVDVVQTDAKAASIDRSSQQTMLDDWLDQVSDLVQTISLEDGRLLYTNRSWCETLGYSRSEGATLAFNDILDPQNPTPFELLWRAFREGDSSASATIDLTLQHRDGKPIAVIAHLDLWQAPGQAKVLRIIMQRRSIPATPPLAPLAVTQDPQEIADLKARFISLASHELRTPLAVIASSASILKDFGDQLDDAKRLKHLQCIQTYVKHTTKLLDDILLINQMETAGLQFRPTPCNLIEVSRTLIADLQSYALQHRLLLSVIADSKAQNPDLGVEGCIDRDLLHQILSHLISNAAKFSPVGSTITVNVTLQPQWIHFEIADEGIGILPEDQPHIYQLFHRGRNVGTIPGAGVGLSIVQSCVELHQGQLSVQSGGYQGTIFQVTLPRFS